MSFPFDNIHVVDPRLAAGRGEQYSASFKRKQEEDALDETDYHLPMGHRPENYADASHLEQSSVDKAISEDNVGFKLLQKMGWKGKGLGRNEDGIVEPVKAGVEAGVRLGVGKQEEDNYYTQADNITRKRLETEIQANEDQTRKEKREALAEREQRIKEDVAQILRTFYCEVCNKQYTTAMELDTHLSSYDHHHKKRLMEMKAMTNERNRGSRHKKEEKRMAKEMARLNEQLRRAQQEKERLHGVAPPPLPTEPAPPPPPADNPAPPPPPPPPDASSTLPTEPTTIPHSTGNTPAPVAPSYQPADAWYAHPHAPSYGHYDASAYPSHGAGSAGEWPSTQPAAGHTYQSAAWQAHSGQPQPGQPSGWEAGGQQPYHTPSNQQPYHTPSNQQPYHTPSNQQPQSSGSSQGTWPGTAIRSSGGPSAVPAPPPPPAPAHPALPAIDSQGMKITLGAGVKPRVGGFAGVKRSGVALSGVASKQAKAAALFGDDSDEEGA